MLYLALSVCFTAGLYLIFRLYRERKVPVFPAIVANYAIASVLCVAALVVQGQWEGYAGADYELLSIASVLGAGLIGIFYVLGLTTAAFGVAASTIISRMSMVVPALFAVAYYGERLYWQQIMGMLLACVAIILASGNRRSLEKAERATGDAWLLPLLAFLGTGSIDSLIQYTQRSMLGDAPPLSILLQAFLTAFFLGILALLFGGSIATLKRAKVWAYGGLLGLANFFSLFFFLLALKHSPFGSAVIFPVNSIGIVLISSVSTVVLFRERLTPPRLAGLALSIVAILLISWHWGQA